MATTKAKRPLTWSEKLDQGLPLTPLEEVQADADFNTKRRKRELEEQQAFEKLKSAGRTTPDEVAAQVAADEEEAGQAESDGKEGNK